VRSRGTPQFWELYRRLPADVKDAARRAYARFRENPAHPGLHLERLRSDERAWSVRVSRDYRAVARRGAEEWVWVWIGSHQDFDRQFPA